MNSGRLSQARQTRRRMKRCTIQVCTRGISTTLALVTAMDPYLLAVLRRSYHLPVSFFAKVKRTPFPLLMRNLHFDGSTLFFKETCNCRVLTSESLIRIVKLSSVKSHSVFSSNAAAASPPSTDTFTTLSSSLHA